MDLIHCKKFPFSVYYFTFFIVILTLSACIKDVPNYHNEVNDLGPSMPESHAKDILSKYVGRDWVENPFFWYNLTEYECVDDSGLFNIINRTRNKHYCHFSDFGVKVTRLKCVRLVLWNAPYPTERRGRPDHPGYKGEIRKLADDYAWGDVCPRNAEDPEELIWILAAFVALGSIYR